MSPALLTTHCFKAGNGVSHGFTSFNSASINRKHILLVEATNRFCRCHFAEDESKPMRILMILTSHSTENTLLDERANALESFSGAYFAFRDVGAEIVLASPKGGLPALYPRRVDKAKQSEIVSRFYNDARARSELADTLRLEQVCADDFDALFYPGSVGSLWDLANNEQSIAIISAFDEAGKPLGFVGYGPSALCRVTSNSGIALVSGRNLTASSASEDRSTIGESEIPFSLEQQLRTAGAIYSSAEDWTCHVVRDDILITGQNVASVVEAAKLLLKLMQS
jgi:putative intracellular protease/amidase